MCYAQYEIDEAKLKVCEAVKYAVNDGTGVFFVASAGNAATSDKVIPASCNNNVIAVGATDDGKRYEFTDLDLTDGDMTKGSNYGSWVDIAAPGRNIMSTMPNGAYDIKSGTSESTPMVTGAAAVLLSRHPNWSNQQIAERLMHTAHYMPGEGLGWGELDLFEAVFNGGFEQVKEDDPNQLEEWKPHPNISKMCEAKLSMLGIIPIFDGFELENNKRMLVCDNTGVRYEGIMNEFDVPEGVTQLPISFDWRMVAEDLNANGSVKTTLVNGSQFIKRDDRVVIRVYNTETQTLSMVDVIPLSLLLSTYNSGQPLVQASNGWYGNNWQTLTKSILVTKGKNQLQIQVVNSGWNSTGDAITLQGTTLFMMDRLRFRLN